MIDSTSFTFLSRADPTRVLVESDGSRPGRFGAVTVREVDFVALDFIVFVREAVGVPAEGRGFTCRVLVVFCDLDVDRLEGVPLSVPVPVPVPE